MHLEVELAEDVKIAVAANSLAKGPLAKAAAAAAAAAAVMAAVAVLLIEEVAMATAAVMAPLEVAKNLIH